MYSLVFANKQNLFLILNKWGAMEHQNGCQNKRKEWRKSTEGNVNGKKEKWKEGEREWGGKANSREHSQTAVVLVV